MELLDLVVTIKEAEERWHYCNSTIRSWIEGGQIRARRSAGTWLIEVPSVEIFLATRNLALSKRGARNYSYTPR